MVDEAVTGCVSLQKRDVLGSKHTGAGDAAVASVVENYGTCLEPCQLPSGHLIDFSGIYVVKLRNFDLALSSCWPCGLRSSSQSLMAVLP